LTGSGAASADILSLSTNTLLPNTAGQTVDLLISGSNTITNSDVNVQINNGSPTVDSPAPGATPPMITSIVMAASGTVFGTSNNLGDISTIYNQWDASDSIGETIGHSITPDTGILAILTISTVGMPNGSFTIQFENAGPIASGKTDVEDTTASGTTSFPLAGDGTTLSVGGNIEGTISISVPEPVSMAMLSLAAPTILMRRRARNA
jgi:hypothetical protein